MSKYRDNIDDIFEALYGSKIDEDGKRYSDEVYYYESTNMEKDYNEYLRCMELASLSPTIEEMMRFVIYTEYMHIGNDHMVRSELDLSKLEKVVTEKLKDNI